MRCSCKIIYIIIVLILLAINLSFGEEIIRIGLNYPKTGPYEVQGMEQWRATRLAVKEINDAGGILGKKIEIIWRDSQSRAGLTTKNVRELIDQYNVTMVFGGSSSGVAIAAANVCQEKGILFFGTLTYSTATTGTDAHRNSFRECYNSWMGAKAIASYLNRKYSQKKYFYITADYTWGWTTEDSVRTFTGTTDTSRHKGVLTPFPSASRNDFKKALETAKRNNPDVLVVVLFGYDMAITLKLAKNLGIKDDMQIIVPNITLGMAESAGPDTMEGVVGALPWCWKVPYKYYYKKGKEFVEKYAKEYNRYPSCSGGSAYTILYEYKAAVERAGSFDTGKVIKVLEGHTYSLLKDEQTWRDFDHQSIQTVYIVKGNPVDEVLKDKYQLDYFKILRSVPGIQVVRTREEWNKVRIKAGKPDFLESLSGEE